MKYLSIILAVLLVTSSLSSVEAVKIPPTPAIKGATTENGTVYAMNYSTIFHLKGLNGIHIFGNNLTKTIIFNGTGNGTGGGSGGTNQGTYNKTLANNVPVNSGGNRINYINGTNATVTVKDDPTRNQVNVTISATGGGGGSGSVTGSQNVGKGTGSFGVLAKATPTLIQGKNITCSTGLSCSGNLTDISILNTLTQGIISLNFTAPVSDFDFHSGNRNVTYTTLDGTVFNTHIKPNVVLTNESAQIIFKAITLNSGILGGNLVTTGFGLSNAGHVSTPPSLTGTLCQMNQTAHCGTDVSNGTVIGSQNVGRFTGSVGVLSTASSTTIKGKNVTGTSPITVTSTNSTDFAIGCPTCGTLSAAITSINSQTGPAVNIVGSNGNITITNSTNQVKINTGSDIPHLSQANNFTQPQSISHIGGAANTLLNITSTSGSSTTIQTGYGGVGQTIMRRADGTHASPSQVLSGEIIGGLVFRGYTSSNTFSGNIATIVGQAAESFTNTAQGINIVFSVVNSSTTSIVEKLRINNYGGLRFATNTDPSAPTQGDFWLSSTNADVYKYRGASATYTIQSSKNFINFTSPSNKTGGTTFVMEGDGVTLTPAVTGRAEITVSGYSTSSVSTDGVAVQIKQITGGCPSSGAAVTGSSLGNNIKMVSSGTTARVPFSITVQTTGLTIGTKYCFELTRQPITGGTATLFNVMWSAKEI